MKSENVHPHGRQWSRKPGVRPSFGSVALLLNDITNTSSADANQLSAKFNTECLGAQVFEHSELESASAHTCRSGTIVPSEERPQCNIAALHTREPSSILPGWQDKQPWNQEYDYSGNVLSNDIQKEAQCLPHADYMAQQLSIDGGMRARLVDWLIEVHRKQKMRRETLFLAVSLVDRYLSAVQVERLQLQLVGGSALFIAAKFEEVCPIEAGDLVFLCDDAFSRDDLLGMECAMLQALDFCTNEPTVCHFLPHFLAASRACGNTNQQLLPSNEIALAHFVWRCNSVSMEDKLLEDVAWYLAELALLDVAFACFPPSHVAASALLLGSKLLCRQSIWPDRLAQLSRHTEIGLAVCVEALHKHWSSISVDPFQQVNKKHFGVAGGALKDRRGSPAAANVLKTRGQVRSSTFTKCTPSVARARVVPYPGQQIVPRALRARCGGAGPAPLR